MCFLWIILWFPLTKSDHSIDTLKKKLDESSALGWKVLELSGRYDANGFRDWDFYGRWRFFPWDEYRHYPGQTQSYKVPPPLPEQVEGKSYTVPPADQSPDFRMPEPPYRPLNTWYKYFEEDRYYRTSPAYLQLKNRWAAKNRRDNPMLLSCYCVTVFKRLTPLGMCSILTLRHVLTTASSTDLILRRYRTKWTMVDILGFWYETDTEGQPWENASYYATPARIHYHPKWIMPDHSNRSHPFPNYYDLAVWGTTYQLINPGKAIRSGKKSTCQVCGRCSGSTNFWYDSPTLKETTTTILVGAQFIRDIGREPFPWFKYAIRTTSGKRNPCPKTEWGWFHCIEMAGQVGKLGHDSGGPLHVAYRGFIYNSRHSGLAGINSFSMRLRSKYFVNYYIVLERHAVLDFLYAAYMGVLRYSYLDSRFQDTKWKGKVEPNWWYSASGRLKDTKYYDAVPANIFYSNSWIKPTSWFNVISSYSPVNIGTIAVYDPIWW